MRRLLAARRFRRQPQGLCFGHLQPDPNLSIRRRREPRRSHRGFPEPWV